MRRGNRHRSSTSIRTYHHRQSYDLPRNGRNGTSQRRQPYTANIRRTSIRGQNRNITNGHQRGRRTHGGYNRTMNAFGVRQRRGARQRHHRRQRRRGRTHEPGTGTHRKARIGRQVLGFRLTNHGRTRRRGNNRRHRSTNGRVNQRLTCKVRGYHGANNRRGGQRGVGHNIQTLSSVLGGLCTHHNSHGTTRRQRCRRHPPTGRHTRGATRRESGHQPRHGTNTTRTRVRARLLTQNTERRRIRRRQRRSTQSHDLRGAT